jgi:hypothetical protein
LGTSFLLSLDVLDALAQQTAEPHTRVTTVTPEGAQLFEAINAAHEGQRPICRHCGAHMEYHSALATITIHHAAGCTRPR